MSHDEMHNHKRHRMINTVLRANGIQHERVLHAMQTVPRHLFVPSALQAQAYQPTALPIAHGQVMLSPLVIARLLQHLMLMGTERILEIGTGTGYLTALLTRLGLYVYSLERILPLADSASSRLQKLGYNNVDLHVGDGSQGLPDMMPFDVIISTASVGRIPRPLAMQLHMLRGRAILPIGSGREQTVSLIQRQVDRWHVKKLFPLNAPALLGRYGMPPSAGV
ncbi:MAG: protein-L-isoaspartate O-methyltransferase [Chloroflexota bacterium]